MLNYNITLSILRLASLFIKSFHPKSLPYKINGGRGGIRTHGPRKRVTGFQDQLLKPLGHPSAYFQFYFFLKARFIIKHLIVYVNNPKGN